jgi:hypothetical protein
MNPTECQICGLCSADEKDGREGDWVKFANYNQLEVESLEQPTGLEFFCSEHLYQAKRLSHLTAGNAISQLRLTLKDEIIDWINHNPSIRGGGLFAKCPICGLLLCDETGGRKGGWIVFSDYIKYGGSSTYDPNGLEYFCSRHFNQAKDLSPLSSTEAIAQLRLRFKEEGGKFINPYSLLPTIFRKLRHWREIALNLFLKKQ